MPLRRSWLVMLLAGSAALTSIPAASVFAAGATGLPVIIRPADANGDPLPGPGYYQVSARPGSMVRLYALVGNKSQQKAVISIVPVDAATGVYGGVTAKLASQPQRQVGTWIHLPIRKLRLGPNKGQVVPFTVTVPKHTRPGQYVGALTAFVPSRTTKRGHGFAFTVQTRLADDVVVTVPGPKRWGFQIQGIRLQRRTIGTYLLSQIRNHGTMLLHGRGYLWVWGPGQKHPILAQALHIGTTLPRTTVQYPIELGLHPRAGRYHYQLKVWWTGGRTTQAGSISIR